MSGANPIKSNQKALFYAPLPHRISPLDRSSEARRKFEIKNRDQAHGWNFGKAEPKRPQTPKGGALARAAMSQLRRRLRAMRTGKASRRTGRRAKTSRSANHKRPQPSLEPVSTAEKPRAIVRP